MSKNLIIIQARTGSTRLPQKVLKKITSYTMLGYVIERLKLSNIDKRIVVATTESKSDDIICEIADKHNVDSFRGSEKDVLQRYIDVLNTYNCEVGVRVTGDCPLIDPFIIDKMINYLRKKDFDYLNVVKNGLPRGLGSEVFKIETLKKINNYRLEDYHREHVTCYMYENPNDFNIGYYPLDKKIVRPDIRLTVDTPEDFMLISKVADYFQPKIDFTTLEIIKFLDENPSLLEINKAVKQKFYQTTN